MYTHDVVKLHIITWVNSCAIGAQHYYATLLFYREGRESWCEHELEYVLDEEGAKRLTDAKANDAPPYKAGETTQQFLCPEKMRREALKQWRIVVPHGKVLIVCGRSECGPVEVLAGPRKLVRLGNQLWERWERSEHNDALCVQLENQWDRLFDNAGFRG